MKSLKIKKKLKKKKVKDSGGVCHESTAFMGESEIWKRGNTP